MLKADNVSRSYTTPRGELPILANVLLEQKNGAWIIKGTTVKVTAVKVSELGAACSRLLDGIVTGSVVHTRQPQLSTAVSVAGKRRLGVGLSR